MICFELTMAAITFPTTLFQAPSAGFGAEKMRLWSLFQRRWCFAFTAYLRVTTFSPGWRYANTSLCACSIYSLLINRLNPCYTAFPVSSRTTCVRPFISHFLFFLFFFPPWFK
ncbi:hypothetical protein M433DRAFT_322968 [Acidomyces richmondensis BFW]|nr:MAG: hypothetical protein FE78DRAFT_492186 [Acidomyces sp. 'richmondensis']KYG49339.1 hypothetical protein M433DRAFT_322968 [Acidomyces richmondensis BFW]